MPIEIRDRRVLYYPIPKVACTSIKHHAHFLNTGQVFAPFKENDRWVHIHSERFMPTRYFEGRVPGDAISFVVIRDPVERLLSAYENRVLKHWALTQDKLDRGLGKPLGLKKNPDPDTFFENFEKYRVASKEIEHHTDPASYFVGHRLDAFSRVFRISETRELEVMLNELCGVEAALPRTQESHGKKPKFADLSVKAQDVIRRFTYGDYALMRGYYEPA